MEIETHCPCGIALPAVIYQHRQNPSYSHDDEAMHKEWHQLPSCLSDVAKMDDTKLWRHYMSCQHTLSKLHCETRAKAAKALKWLSGTGSYVVMTGGTEDQWSYYQSDVLTCVFKQEQFFRYMFAIDAPDCIGIYNIDTQETSLFLPEMPEAALKFLGEQDSYGKIKKTWGFDHVGGCKDAKAFIETLDRKSSHSSKTCYVLSGTNDDSGIKTKNTSDMTEYDITAQVDEVTLYKILEECRVTKTPREAEMLRACAYISSLAHVVVMKNTYAELEELFHEAIFKGVCTITGGARNVAYNCICASKVNAAILHYGHAAKPNNRYIKNGDLLLHDMGGIFPSGYVADITTTYPVSGNYNADQTVLYNAVLKANREVIAMMKPGVDWIQCHLTADKHILYGLMEVGVIRNDLDEATITDLITKRLPGYFMPHGLGHLIGLDVHDCGGHNEASKEWCRGKPGLSSLRCTRELEEGMYITVEPGCYFIPYLMDELKSSGEFSDYLNYDKIDQLIELGGIRIEDDVMVTATGVVCYSPVPRNIADIEAVLNTRK